MSTDKLFLALEKKAINDESSKIRNAYNNFNAALRWPNGASFDDCFKVEIETGDESKITITVSHFFNCLEKRLLKERKESVVNREIDNFMRSQEKYATQVRQMEHYLEHGE